MVEMYFYIIGTIYVTAILGTSVEFSCNLFVTLNLFSASFLQGAMIFISLFYATIIDANANATSTFVKKSDDKNAIDVSQGPFGPRFSIVFTTTVTLLWPLTME